MKQLIAMAAVVVPALFSVAACGEAESRGAVDVRPALAAVQATHALRAAFDVDCEPVIQQLLEDAQALQETPAFKALAATPEYEAVMADEDAIDENNCYDEAPKAACEGILKKYSTDAEALEQTPQYQTVQATPEFAKLAGDVTEAQTLGCIEEAYRPYKL